jgi:hypothetical protein
MAEKKTRVWCTLKQKMNAVDRLDKGDSLKKWLKIQVSEIQQSKPGEKSKGHPVIFHDSRGRSFIGVS